jgi:hypothetical protein
VDLQAKYDALPPPKGTYLEYVATKYPGTFPRRQAADSQTPRHPQPPRTRRSRKDSFPTNRSACRSTTPRMVTRVAALPRPSGLARTTSRVVHAPNRRLP